MREIHLLVDASAACGFARRRGDDAHTDDAAGTRLAFCCRPREVTHG